MPRLNKAQTLLKQLLHRAEEEGLLDGICSEGKQLVSDCAKECGFEYSAEYDYQLTIDTLFPSIPVTWGESLDSDDITVEIKITNNKLKDTITIPEGEITVSEFYAN